MSVNSLPQPSVGGSAPYVGDVPPAGTAPTNNAATASGYVADGSVDKAVMAGVNAFWNPESANGTANEQAPGYVGPAGVAVPVSALPVTTEKGWGTAAPAPAANDPLVNANNAPVGNSPAATTAPASGPAAASSAPAGDPAVASSPPPATPAATSNTPAASDRPAPAASSNGGSAQTGGADSDRSSNNSTDSSAGRNRLGGGRNNAGAVGGNGWGTNHQEVVSADPNAKTDVNNSAAYKTSTNGDATNGEKSTLQAGVWSGTGAYTENDADGVAARASASGSVGGQADGGFSKTAGPLSVDGTGSAWAGAQGRASAGAAWSDESGHYAQAGFEGRMGVGVDGAVTGRVGPAEVGASGKASVGAETSNGFIVGQRTPTAAEKAEGITGVTGAQGSVGGFAGAKAEGTVKTGIGGNTVGVTGGVYAGVGVQASVNVGISQDDKGKSYLNLGGAFGAALGLGAKLGLDLRINITPLVKVFDAIKGPVKEVMNDIKEGLKKGAEWVGDKVGDAVEAVKDVGKKVGDGVKHAAEKVGGFFKGLFS